MKHVVGLRVFVEPDDKRPLTIHYGHAIGRDFEFCGTGCDCTRRQHCHDS